MSLRFSGIVYLAFHLRRCCGADPSDTVVYDASKNAAAIEADEAIRAHISNTFTDTDELFWMRQSLLRDGYLKISNVVPSVVKSRVMEEARTLLAAHSKRRDLLMEVTGNSPRYLSNVRQQDIARWGEAIPAVYHSSSLIDFLSQVAHENVIANPWEFEKFTVNRLEKAGDTHGWHWGDYPYSMIWIVEAPPPEQGGVLETVPHTYWDKKNPRVEEHLRRNPIQTKTHVSGDVYLLKSDTTLHRVTPMLVNGTRIIINMAWERARDKDREVSHETFAFRE
jgi:hypothetical protein